ncbi:MAG: hypothetical protein B7Z83_11400 [Thiomonas sp. 20-64-5]|nr:MAG: hypothetical protein B7Z83_11400 [Thiomonas sp. 20-64-5]
MGMPWLQTLPIGTADGVLTSWQLTDGGGFAITIPTNGQIFANGVLQVLTTNYTVSGAGVVTFVSAPASGVVLTLSPGSGYIDRLWWPSQSSRSQKPALWSAKFGDGYEQNAPQGINNDPEKWQLQFKLQDRADGDGLIAFLQAAGGNLAFSWRSIRGPNPIRVLCKGWSDITKPSGPITLNATFEQVFGQ